MRQHLEVLAAFRRYCHLRSYSARTTNKYQQRVVQAETWLKRNRGKSLIWANVKDLSAWMFSTGTSARNRNSARAALVAFYDFCMEAELVGQNPARSVSRVPEPHNLPRHHSAQIVASVLAVAGLFDLEIQSLIAVLVWTGLRKTECRLLEWSHLDMTSGFMRVRGKGRGGMESGGGKVREVPMHPELIKTLQAWRATTQSSRWVFPSPRFPDKPISDTCFRDWVWRVGEEIGVVKLNPHSLRHSLATRVYEQSKDLLAVRDLLGHSDVRTTQVYTHLHSSRLGEVMRGVDWSRDEGGDELPSGVRPGTGLDPTVDMGALHRSPARDP